MLHDEASASIQAPPEAVWRRLSDVIHWSDWTPTVNRVDALDGPELATGRRFRVQQPRLRAAVWSVTLVEVPTRFVWEARTPGVVMRADHEVERLPSGESRLTLRFSFEGLLGGLVGRLYRKLVRSYLATEAECLRRYVEQDGGVRPVTS
jgi:carbon monoxide dehydrogenase subunit G